MLLVLYLKAIPMPQDTEVFSWVTFRSFIGLHFAFRSLTYFELILVKGVRSSSSFIFCMWIFSDPSTICWKEYLFYIVLVLFLGSLFWSIDLFVYSFTKTHCLNYHSFIVSQSQSVGPWLYFSPWIQCWLFLVFYLFIQTLESVSQYLQN